jgi:hypothetical protein
MTATGNCVAPIASGVSTGGGQVGAGCSVNGMPGTWMYAGGTATLTCMPMATAAANATANAGVGSTTAGAAMQLGSACSSNGQPGYMGYVGAVISCLVTATITTPVNTRSCAQDGYPPTWTRSANGSCVSPVDIATPMTIGGGCLVGGMPGTYGYSGANIVCFPNTGASTPVATAPSTGITPTLGSYCLSGALPGSYQYVGATIMCVATSTAPVATAPSTGITPTLGSSCPVGGSTGYYQYVGAVITCIATTTSTAWSTATTSPSSGITAGAACSASGFAGTYQYSGVALICVATPVATTPTTVYVATTTTTTMPPTCPAVTPYMWTDGTCRATRQY